MYYRGLEPRFLGLDQLFVNFTVKVVEKFQHAVVLSCFPEWQQDDIDSILQVILSQHTNFTLKESNKGLDRESFRLSEADADYWLHFECYSQSIWLEPMNDRAQQEFELLYQSLLKRQSNHE